jgi:mono/diheme cytochrome c family protein
MPNMRILLATAWLLAVPAYAADSAAGQKIFQARCAACHQLKSFAGKPEAELQTAIKGIVAGSVKHPKKLTLGPADIDDVASYIASDEPK